MQTKQRVRVIGEKFREIWAWKQEHLWFVVSNLNTDPYSSKEDKRDIRWASALTWRLSLFPEVIEALKAPWVLQSQLVIKVPEQQGHEDDEESNGSQKPQHLRRDWNTQGRVQAACKCSLPITFSKGFQILPKENKKPIYHPDEGCTSQFVLISITACI